MTSSGPRDNMVKALLFTVFGMSCFVSAGQTSITEKQMYGKTVRCIERMNKILFSRETGISMVRDSSHWGIDPLMDQLYKDRLSFQEKAVKGKTGLDLSASYSHKFGVPVADQLDDESGFVYDDRYQVTLKWDILKSSLYNRSNKLRIVELENELARKDHRGLSIETQFENALLLNAHQTDQVLCLVASYRHEVLSQLEELQEFLLQQYKILENELIETQIQLYKTNLESRCREVDESVKIFPESDFSDIFEIDKEVLFYAAIENDQAMAKLLLEDELLVAKANSSRYVHNIGVGPYVRGNYYHQNAGKNAANVDIGIQLNIPLDFSYKHQKNGFLQAQEITGIKKTDREKKIRQHIEDLSRRCELINLEVRKEYRILKAVLENIRVVTKVKQYHQAYQNMPEVLREYDKYWKQLYILYGLRGQREQLFIQCQKLTDGLPPVAFLRAIPIELY